MSDQGLLTFREYLELCSKRKAEHPEWRLGQTYYNVLRELKPQLAMEVNSSLVDPFYDDGKIDSFLSFVGAEWIPAEHD